MKSKIIIMAGGSGQRLWPKSTKKKPKQFCSIASNKTMLQETLDRFDFIPKTDIYISSTQKYENIIKKDYIDYSLILEPHTMDTAPSICLNTLSIDANDDDILIFCPSDHYIQKKENFKKDIQKSIEFIKKNDDQMLLIGIQPTYPATSFGYIKSNIKKNRLGSVIHFKEKPNLETAKKYIESNNYFWNSGIFCFKKSFITKVFSLYQPSLIKSIKKYIETKNIDFYKNVEKISFDFAITEKLQGHVSVLKNSFNWSDIGSWNNLNDLLADDKKNYSMGKNLNFETQNTLSINDSSLQLITNGVKDLNIIVSNNTIYIESKYSNKPIKDILKKID